MSFSRNSSGPRTRKASRPLPQISNSSSDSDQEPNLEFEKTIPESLEKNLETIFNKLSQFRNTKHGSI